MSNIDHAAISREAARREFKTNPDKTWKCPIRRRCEVCNGMIEVGADVKQHRGPGSIKHATC